MAHSQNISPDRSESSNLAKQNDEAVTIKDRHSVTKRLVSYHFIFTYKRIVQNKNRKCS